MKKFLSMLCLSAAFSVALQSAPLIQANAADYAEEYESVYAPDVNASNPDLANLASSLGADTDCFNFKNYTPQGVSQEFIDKIDDINSYGPVDVFHLLNERDICYGMSVLQILAHNGVISASDIQKDAKTLNAVKFNNDINDVIEYYSALSYMELYDLASNEYLCSHDLKDQCQDLISYGKKAMDTGKYFFISVNSLEKGYYKEYFFTGIGIADGNWVYNGKSYDKCVLTLDNTVGGFSEKNCIYINSKTNQYYFPGLNNGSENSAFTINFITDDTGMLNYNGWINPSKSLDEKYKNMKKVTVWNRQESEYDVSVAADGKTNTYHGNAGDVLKGIVKNYWRDQLKQPKSYYVKNADSMSVQNISAINDEYYDRGMTISIDSLDFGSGVTFFGLEGYVEGEEFGLFKGNVEKHKAVFESLSEGANRYGIELSDKTDEFACTKPYVWASIQGVTNGKFSAEMTDEGVLLSDTDGVKCDCIFYDTYNDNEIDPSWDEPSDVTFHKRFQITAADSVMIKYNKDTDSFYFTIGDNYDTVVQKGDVNCDGNIDAVDASYILSGYADAQTGGRNYVNEILGDFNDDGNIDAIDASYILSYYADSQTK